MLNEPIPLSASPSSPLETALSGPVWCEALSPPASHFRLALNTAGLDIPAWPTGAPSLAEPASAPDSPLLHHDARLDPAAGDPVLNWAQVSPAWHQSLQVLRQFHQSPGWSQQMVVAFGEKAATTAASELLGSLIQGRIGPRLAPLPEGPLNAYGAYSAANNTLFLAQLPAAAMVPVLLEELGHFIDSHLNGDDAPGDEGAIFAALVQGQDLSQAELAALRTEDDRASLRWQGQSLQVEQAAAPGVFTVGASGQITVDFRADSGAYQGELAVFSLDGMAGLVPGSKEFIQTAARRALSDSPLGYRVVSDATAGAALTGQLGEANWNQGPYPGAQTLAFQPGASIALMLMPNGAIATALDTTATAAAQRPLFSMDAANPGGYAQIGQLQPGLYGLEDLRRDQGSDLDFNDWIISLTGASGTVAALPSLAGAKTTWLNTPLGLQLQQAAPTSPQPSPLELPPPSPGEGSGAPEPPPPMVAPPEPPPIAPPPSDIIDIPAVISSDVFKFTPSSREADLLASGAIPLVLGSQRLYAGTYQISGNNQNPIIASFDDANPANNWVRSDFETTGADGRAQGLAWSGGNLYGVFTVDGTQGDASQDFRRASGDAQQSWLRSYGAGGGRKVSVLGRIDPFTGELLDAAYLSALLSDGSSNTLVINDIDADPDGNLVVQADSYFAPRRPSGERMTQVGSGGSPFAYLVEITPDLKRVVRTEAEGWV